MSTNNSLPANLDGGVAREHADSVIIQSAGGTTDLTSAVNEHTLQALVELVYIRTGNEVMQSALAGLETALESTQKALNSLSALQDLHNQIATPATSAIPFDFSASNQTIPYTYASTAFSIPNPNDMGNGNDTVLLPVSKFDLATFSVQHPGIATETYYFTRLSDTNNRFTIRNPADPNETFFLAPWNMAAATHTVYQMTAFVNGATQTFNVTANAGTGYVSFSIQNLAVPSAIGHYTSLRYANDNVFSLLNPLDTGETYYIPWNTTIGNTSFTMISPYQSNETLSITASVINSGLGAFSVKNSADPDVQKQLTSVRYYRYFASANTPNHLNTVVYFTYPQGSGATRTFQSVLTVNDMASYINAYSKIASAYYGKPIDPIFKVTIPQDYYGAGNPPTSLTSTVINSSQPAFQYFIAKMQSTRAQISALIATLASATDPSQAQGSLLQTLRTVRDELPKNYSYSAIHKWVIDGYNVHNASGVANAGKIQTDLTAAITAAESLNDSQKESVRNYMFIFEEYYKSASAILNTLNQIIQKMAQNAGR